jgi:predicted nucleotidyltransferase
LEVFGDETKPVAGWTRAKSPEGKFPRNLEARGDATAQRLFRKFAFESKIYRT